MRKKRTTITKQIIKNTYALYLKGVDRGIMSSVLSISPISIKRIVKLIKAAENGDYQTFESVSGFKKMKSMVRDMFGIKSDTKPDKEAEDDKTDAPTVPPAALCAAQKAMGTANKGHMERIHRYIQTVFLQVKVKRRKNDL